MTCQVCYANWIAGSRCPQCGYDSNARGAGEASRILAAREVFHQQHTAYALQSRVSLWDRWRPWWAIALGFTFFLIWARTLGAIWRSWWW